MSLPESRPSSSPKQLKETIEVVRHDEGLEKMADLAIDALEEQIESEQDWFRKLIALGLYQDHLTAMDEVQPERFQFLNEMIRNNYASPLVIANALRTYGSYLPKVTAEVLQQKLRADLQQALQDSWEASREQAEAAEQPVALFSPALSFPRWLAEADLVEEEGDNLALRHWAERNLKDLIEAEYYKKTGDLVDPKLLDAFLDPETMDNVFAIWQKLSDCYGEMPRLEDNKPHPVALAEVEKLAEKLRHYLVSSKEGKQRKAA